MVLNQTKVVETYLKGYSRLLTIMLLQTHLTVYPQWNTKGDLLDLPLVFRSQISVV